MVNLKKFGFISALLMLSGCVVDGGNDYRPPVRPQPSQIACPLIHAPVCGERNGMRRTMANECTAKAQGYRVVSRGECGSRPGNGWGNNDRPSQSQRPRPPRPPYVNPGKPVTPSKPSQIACTREFNPVCAIRGNKKRNFPNSCEARSAGYRVVNGAQC